MRLYNYTIDDINESPVTLVKACDSCGKVLASEKQRVYKDYWTTGSGYDLDKYDFNASDIQTKIIQYVGRFCESYASDVLIELCKLNPFLREVKQGNGRWIIALGLRDYGVDHNEWIMHNIDNNNIDNSNYYRKILAIDIHDEEEENKITRTIELKDITNCIGRIDAADIGKY